MTVKLLKRMMDACYQAKRIRDMLPPLPDGVTPSISPDDGRVTWLTLTETGHALSQKYNQKCFSILADYTETISEEDAECMIRTMNQLYHIMCERRITIED